MNVLSLKTGNVLQEFFEQGREAGRTAEFYLPLSRSVDLDNLSDSTNFGVSRVSIQGETVAGLIDAHVARDAATAKNRKRPVCIVWLYD